MIPFVSVVVPTRNRPWLLRHCLRSLEKQTFRDFEVIICDNSDKEASYLKENQKLIEGLEDVRFRYIEPKACLSLCDNWEFSCQQASGEYISMLTDRMAFYPSTLEHLYNATQYKPYDIVSWSEDIYLPENEYEEKAKGYIQESGLMPKKPFEFNPREELKKRYQIGLGEAEERYDYFRGKICFGAYSQKLVERIRKNVGGLCLPMAPDYTSRISALYYGEIGIDLGIRLMLQVVAKDSNGTGWKYDHQKRLDFCKASAPERSSFHNAPIPGFFSSYHNVLYDDYIYMKNKIFSTDRKITLNEKAIIILCEENIRFCTDVQDSQRKILEQHLKKINSLDRINWKLKKIQKKILYEWGFKKLVIADKFLRVISLLNRFLPFKSLLRNIFPNYRLMRNYSYFLFSRNHFDSVEEAIDAVDKRVNALPRVFFLNKQIKR